MLQRIRSNLGRVILAAALAVAFAVLLCVYIATDRAYVPPEDALGTRVSVEAFSKGYDAVLEELTTPPEPEETVAEELLAFSLDEEGTAFFSRSVELTITNKGKGTIYYTVDGTDPRTSESSWRFSKALTLERGVSAPLVYRVKAAIWYGLDDWSEVYSRTYFVGMDIEDQFAIPVYAIELPEEDLWSYKTGIFNDANKNRHGVEWERAMQVQLFDSDGSLIFDMPAGIRIYGGYSRSHVMKSMRITARKRYSTVLDDFNSMSLFGLMYDAEGVRIDRFEDMMHEMKSYPDTPVLIEIKPHAKYHNVEKLTAMTDDILRDGKSQTNCIGILGGTLEPGLRYVHNRLPYLPMGYCEGGKSVPAAPECREEAEDRIYRVAQLTSGCAAGYNPEDVNINRLFNEYAKFRMMHIFVWSRSWTLSPSKWEENGPLNDKTYIAGFDAWTTDHGEKFLDYPIAVEPINHAPDSPRCRLRYRDGSTSEADCDILLLDKSTAPDSTARVMYAYTMQLHFSDSYTIYSEPITIKF